MKPKIILVLFIILKGLPAFSYQQQDTLQLFYNIGQKDITVFNKAKLDSLNKLLIDTSKVYIFGFADYLGRPAPNYILSKDRAETVKNYLLGLHGKNVFVADGKGEVNNVSKNISPLGDPFNRRVDIIITPSLKKNKNKLSKLPVARHNYDSVYKRIYTLGKINVGESVSFMELTFIPGRHILNPEAVPILEALTDYLNAHENLVIEIQGHICCMTGNQDAFDIDEPRNKLSVNRAKYIYTYLVRRGVRPERMLYKGLGSSDPKIFPEQTDADQLQNRRVVIVLLRK